MAADWHAFGDQFLRGWFDERPNVRVERFAQFANVGGNICGTKEDPINTINIGDGLCLRDRLAGFELQQHSCLIFNAVQIIGHAPIVVGTCRPAEPAHAVGRIPCGGNGLFGLFHRIDHWKEQPFGLASDDRLFNDLASLRDSLKMKLRHIE